MSTVDKLNKVLETKEAIKQAIIDKGQTVGDVFAEYPTAIQNIQGGSGTFVVPGWMCFGYSTVDEFPEDWDWSEVEKIPSANYLFYQCANLKEVPNIKFVNLTSTSSMYSYTKISINPSIDTSQVKQMTNMFGYCWNLTEVKDFDTSSATGMGSLFSNCTKLQTVSELDASKLTVDLYGYNSPFDNCYLLRNFDGFKGLKVNMYLDRCYSLSYESLMNVINKLADGVSGKTLYLQQDCVNMLSDDNIAIATSKGWSISPARTITEPVVVTDLSQIPKTTYQITPRTYDFSQYSGSWMNENNSELPCRANLYSFEADLSGTTDATRMFCYCTKLAYVKLVNTGGITNMSNMFNNATNITNIEIDDTSNVTDMSQMFYSSYIDFKCVENLNVSKVVNLQEMFAGALSRDSDTLDLSKWHFDSDNVNMTNMFYRTGFKHIILGDLSKVTSMNSMFSTASNVTSNLTSITMKGPVSSTVDVTSMFSKLKTTGTFYYNPAYDYSQIIAVLPSTWTAVPLTE